jgi:hypothetical protein
VFEIQENDSSIEDEEASVTPHELLSHIRGWGDGDITDRKIERWYKEDCLPRPHHIYIAGLRGSLSRYPAHAVAQALALCQLQRVKRYSFDALRILLWIDGFPIPPERVRASLQSAIEAIRDDIRRHWKASWRDKLAVAEGLVTRVAPRLARTMLGSLMKQRLSEQDQISFLTMQMQLLVGDVPAFDSGDEYVTEDREVVDKPLAEVFVDVYGLQRAQTDALGDAKPWLPRNIAPTLIELARRQVLSLKYVLATVQDATPNDLEQARADRDTMFVRFPEFVRGAEVLFGENAFGFGMFRMLADWTSKDDATYQALVVGGLLVIRRSGYGQALNEISTAIRFAAAANSRWQTLLAALARELPDIGQAIVPDPALAKGHTDFTAYMQNRLCQIQEIATRYRNDLDAFFERHPELLSDEGLSANHRKLKSMGKHELADVQ